MAIDMVFIKRSRRRFLLTITCSIIFLFLFFNYIQLSFQGRQQQQQQQQQQQDLLQQQHETRYLIVIASQVKHKSRRDLLRSAYFGIQYSLIPTLTNENVQYVFCVHGEIPSMDTPEKRALEMERMEWNDIMLLGELLDYHSKTIIDWIYTNYMTEKNILDIYYFDYIIIQDVHSVFVLDKLIKAIDDVKGDTSIHWIAKEEGVSSQHVIGSSAFENLLLGDDTTITSLPSQNLLLTSTTTTNDDIILFTNVYQDKDLITLNQKPIIQLQESRKNNTVVIVTSAYIPDKCTEPSATRAALNKRKYADRHGYDFIARSDEFISAVTTQQNNGLWWGQLDLIKKVLPKYEWLLWLDTDAIILNQNQTIQQIFKVLKKDYNFADHQDFIMVQQSSSSSVKSNTMINPGIFMIKNTPSALDLLDEWQRQPMLFQQDYMSSLLLLKDTNHLFNMNPSSYISGDFVVYFQPTHCLRLATIKGLAAAERLLQGRGVFAHQLVD